MGKHKYTPGPWKADGVIVRASGDEFICALDHGHLSQAECEANAQLIAAAPELMGGLMLLIQSVENLAKKNPQDREYSLANADKWLQRFRAAIAKAQGETK